MTIEGAPPRRRVVVIGGGISGLAAAHALAESFEVILLEAQASTGGLIRTSEFEGRPLDLAADVFVTRIPDAEKLAWSLGLGGELVAPATSSASVFARGAVRPLPRGLVLGVPTDLRALWTSGVVSWRSVFRAALDLVELDALGKRTSELRDADPTIAEVIEPRLGHEVLTNLIDPLLGGINAGDARYLSFRATAPILAEALAGKTSLIRSLRPIAHRAHSDVASPMFLGLSEGMAMLTDRLASECVRLGVRIRRSIRAQRLTKLDNASIGIVTSKEVVNADGVVVALPAWASAHLIRPMSNALAHELEGIPYASVATVTLAYPLDSRPSSPALGGSGVLIPRGAALSTALTFVTAKWPRPAVDRGFIIRASAGHHGDERLLGIGDDELVGRVGAEISAMLGIDASPIASHVERFADAFPQYVSGTFTRRDRIARLAGDLGAIVLTGSWSDGIGIPACIASARSAAARLTDQLR